MDCLLMSKKIKAIISTKEICTFKKCENFKELITFIKVFMRGFNNQKYKFVFYLVGSLAPKYDNFLVYTDDKIVGCFCICTEVNLEKGSSEVYLYDFCILDEYRHMGIGTDVLKCVLNYVYTLGYDKLTLEVEDNNTIALLLYKKLGFEREELKCA